LQRPPDQADVQRRLAALTAAHSRLWVVEYGADEADPSGIVSSWLGQHAFLATHRWFGSAQLLLYATAGSAATLTPLQVHFSNGAELAAYALETPTAVPGSTVRLLLLWRDDAPIAERYTVFTHLLDSHNHVMAQHDGEPSGNTRPTTTWQRGDTITDLHGLTLPAQLVPGAYTLEVGLYVPQTMTRAQVLGADGKPVADRVLLDQVMVTAR
jgi:hypothetical protein